MASEKKTPVKDQENQSDPVQVVGTAKQIVDTALTGVSETNRERAGSLMEMDGADGDRNVADKFRGLPMRDLIGAPLIAAAEAQQNLAAVALDFYKKIAFTEEKGSPKTRTISFDIKRPVHQGGKLEMVNQHVEAPFIGLVPIPALLIDRVDIDFQMEVTDNNVDKSSSHAEATSKITGGWWVTKAEISGKVTSSKENTRTTNQTAKYQVHVTATQQPPTEGLSKLMDIMASCIEPLAVEDKPAT